LAAANFIFRNKPKRDQQKWNPVLRPIAVEIFKRRMTLSPDRARLGGSCATDYQP